MKTAILSFITAALLLSSCSDSSSSPSETAGNAFSFSTAVEVEVSGYDDHLMEPFLSGDGQLLFFNNSNHPTVNTDIHYAERTDDTHFIYKGEISGVNSSSLDGVPSMDMNNNFYFISGRTYFDDYNTVYRGIYSDGEVSSLEVMSEITKKEPGWLIFDSEISRDGKYFYSADGRYDADGGPYEADFFLAAMDINNTLKRVPDDDTFKNINTNKLEYAACISSDLLEFYFTRAAPFPFFSEPKLYAASRKTVNEPFGAPVLIREAEGFVEAATLSPDDKIIYFHGKDESGIFSLYMIKKIIK